MLLCFKSQLYDPNTCSNAAQNKWNLYPQRIFSVKVIICLIISFQGPKIKTYIWKLGPNMKDIKKHKS